MRFGAAALTGPRFTASPARSVSTAATCGAWRCRASGWCWASRCRRLS